MTFNGGHDDFVAKVTRSGAGLAYAGYIGGAGNDGGSVATDSGPAIAVDAAGNAYVGGGTDSTSGFPAVAGPDATENGGVDGFVAKIGTRTASVCVATSFQLRFVPGKSVTASTGGKALAAVTRMGASVGSGCSAAAARAGLPKGPFRTTKAGARLACKTPSDARFRATRGSLEIRLGDPGPAILTATVRSAGSQLKWNTKYCRPG